MEACKLGLWEAFGFFGMVCSLTPWDEGVDDLPSNEAKARIQQKYSASSTMFQWPLISITTNTGY